MRQAFVLDPIHAAPEKFENEALFLRLGIPSTQIRHENEAFRKRSSNQRNLKTWALRFIADQKYILKTEFQRCRALL